LTATNRIREILDGDPSFSRKISIFQAEIKNQICSIENSKDKYLKSQKLKFLRNYPFLKSDNDNLFNKLKLTQQKLTDALTLVYEQNTNTLSPEIRTLLKETQTALTACKDSLSAISSYESNSISDKRFALGAVIVNFVSSAVVPCIVQVLAATGSIPASVAAVGVGTSAFLAAPVLSAIIGVAIGVVALCVGIKLYHYYKNRSENPSHNTTLALEEFSRCLTMMDESLCISEQSTDRPINLQQLAPVLAEALSDQDIAAFGKFLTLITNSRNALGGHDQPLDVDAIPIDAISLANIVAETCVLPVPTRAPSPSASIAINQNVLREKRIAYFSEVRELTHL
jgi:hypothetical protein